MADHLRTELPPVALTMAFTDRCPASNWFLHHSDRGCQSTAATYRAALDKAWVSTLMSRTRNCYDNAVAESFFGTLKANLLSGNGWTTQAEARLAVFECISVFYDRRRRHSALGQQGPAAFEADWLANRSA